MFASLNHTPLLLFLLAAPICAETFVFQNVTVIDGTGAQGRPRQIVVVSNGRIVSVGRTLPRKLKGKPRIVSGTGKFLIPGLWDMHAHLEDEKTFRQYLSRGIVGVRDMGSDPARIAKWDQRGGPAIITSRRPVDGPSRDVVGFPVLRVKSPEDGRRAVDTLYKEGADFVKVLSTTPREAYFALTQRARLLRLPVGGHVPESVSVREAIDSRQRSMDHLFGLLTACSTEEDELRQQRAIAIEASDNAGLRRIRQRTYDTFSAARAAELFQQMIRYEVWQVPTLSLRKRLAVYAEDYDQHVDLVRRMHRAGVPLLAGTDSTDPLALHEELELLVSAGMTPLQAIRSATRDAARFLNIETTAGAIAVGKSADLVLLDADPARDIRNTRKIRMVMVRGKLLTH